MSYKYASQFVVDPVWEDRLAVFANVQTSGTNGANQPAEAWEEAELNTEVFNNTNGLVSLNTGTHVITLDKGYKYKVFAIVPLWDISRCQTRLNDTTATATYPGTTGCASSANDGFTTCFASYVFDLTSATQDHEITLQIWGNLDVIKDYSQGLAADFSESEVYQQMVVEVVG